MIYDPFDRVKGEKIFSKTDRRLGYHQVMIQEYDIINTSFRTRYDHYVFLVIPFELINAPINFMCMMNNIFSMYLDKFVLVFIYDILIHSKNDEENEEHLKIVLQTS